MLYCAIKRRFKGDNNGYIAMSIREIADDINCVANTALRAVHGLIDKGFIAPRVLGTFTRKDRHATEWRLAEYSLRIETADRLLAEMHAGPTGEYAARKAVQRFRNNPNDETKATALEALDQIKGNRRHELRKLLKG